MLVKAEVLWIVSEPGKMNSCDVVFSWFGHCLMVELVGARTLTAGLERSQNWMWRMSFWAMRYLVVSLILTYNRYRQCWKFPQVRRSEADNFGGGPETFCWFFFNFIFMIWDSSHEDLQLFWLSFKHWVPVSSCLTWERISTTCALSVWRNDIKYEYIFCSLWTI